jgi:TIR domain
LPSRLLKDLGATLDAAADAPVRRQDALALIHDMGDLGKFPAAFTAENMAIPHSKLASEHRMGPHNLALLALHRARLLLGRRAGMDQALHLFISHAKADGLFLAQALRNFISQVPELHGWYDADDLQSGRRWRKQLEAAASQSVLIAVRTEGYSASRWCQEEFEFALSHGVPVITVDALSSSSIPASSLPFSAVPNVRVADGNFHRILRAALREHLRILLVETSLATAATSLPSSMQWAVWPRLPSWHELGRFLPPAPAPATPGSATVPTSRIIVTAEAIQSGREYDAARDWLARLQSPLQLKSIADFRTYCDTFTLPATLPPAPISAKMPHRRGRTLPASPPTAPLSV